MEKHNQSQYIKMTQTPVLPLIASLSVPTILSMLVTNIYNLADTAFVGQLGTAASGAVGIVFGYMAIIQAAGFMFGQGAGSIMARLLGARRVADAEKTASTAFFCSLISGGLIGLVSLIFLDPVVRVLGSTETIAPYARTYILFIIASAPLMTASFTMNNLLRYDGKASLGMIGLMTGAVMNMVGDPILIFGLRMGIAGAGLSTALSQTASFCILLSMFLRGKTTVGISLKRAEFLPARIFDICATGFPSMIRQALNALTTIVLNTCAKPYGDVAIAAMSIVSRISFFVFSIALGIGQGYQPVSAFNFGARKYGRLRKAFRVTAALSETVMLAGVVLVLAFSGNLIGTFRDDPEVIAIGTRALRLHMLGMLALPFGMTVEMTLQSTGSRLAASVLSSMRSGLFFIPLILILSRLRGLAGIQEAQPLAYILATLWSLIFMKRFFGKIPLEDEDEEDRIVPAGQS
ncbi:MAG: MATE family efflux transporter [Lachnospiraceae bacterium]|jgi:putative MATE family efflux protein|nr:MATE family efflux transporter [Lachnospiraceae bacterium]